MVKRGSAKLWILRRLKAAGATRQILLDVYYKQVRSVLEYAAPLWTGQISKLESRKLERIQKCAISIIFNRKFYLYRKTLKENQINSLAYRRKKLALKFAKKTLKHKKFKNWFKPKSNKINIFERVKFKKVIGNKQKLRKTPIAYLTELLNSYNSGKLQI